MFDEIFRFLIRDKKQKNLPCEYGEWRYEWGCYQRNCTKCGARQVKKEYHSELIQSHCYKLGKNTFRNYEK